MDKFRQERDGLLIGPYESEHVMVTDFLSTGWLFLNLESKETSLSNSKVQMEEWARDKVTPGFGKV